MTSAKPGFVGPWWLVGLSRPHDIREELAYDLFYLRNYSIWSDLAILMQTTRHFLRIPPQWTWIPPAAIRRDFELSTTTAAFSASEDAALKQTGPADP
jgi:hypothetical protein